MKFFAGIFYIFHGLVHLLYMGHSLNYFELEKGFLWPNNSKLLANIFGLQTKKVIAGVLCIISAISFFLAGVCVMADHTWHHIEIIVAMMMSTLLFIAFWDGTGNKLHRQGGIAILINILICVYTFG